MSIDKFINFYSCVDLVVKNIIKINTKMELKTILKTDPFSNSNVEYGLFSFNFAIGSLMADDYIPNLWIKLTVYLIIKSIKVSLAEGSIKLNKRTLNRVEIKIPINVAMK